VYSTAPDDVVHRNISVAETWNAMQQPNPIAMILILTCMAASRTAACLIGDYAP
jgi:hypothetical protein